MLEAVDALREDAPQGDDLTWSCCALGRPGRNRARPTAPLNSYVSGRTEARTGRGWRQRAVMAQFKSMLWTSTLVALARERVTAHPSGEDCKKYLHVDKCGIRVHREYLRNAKRYGHMARHLKTIADEMRAAQTNDEFVKQAKRANHLMLREQQDWRVVVSRVIEGT